MDTKDVNRVEVIDFTNLNAGRVFTKQSDEISVKVVLQDDGKTLKVFIMKKED